MNIETCLVRHDCRVTTKGSFLDLEYVLHCIESGSLLYRSEKESYSISSGDMILIPPNTLHAVSDTENVNMTVIHFIDHSHFLDSRDIVQVVHLPERIIPYLSDMTVLLRENWLRGKQEDRCICEGITQTIVGLHLQQSLKQGKTAGGKSEFKNWESIKFAIQFIHREFRNPDLSVLDVSCFVGLSYNYFSSHFSLYTNETPLNYINRVRIEHAKTLLYQHSLNVSEAAFDSGFKSPQYFSRIFRQKEGLSPSKWLRKFN